MIILMVNKFYYIKGGSETYYFALKRLLESKGHTVVDFSMQDDRNIPCDQDKYFVSNVDYNDPNLKGIRKIKTGIDLIYNFEAKKKFEQLIVDEKPDVAHIGLLHRQITFSVVDVLKKYL